MRLKTYTESDADVWDAFVEQAPMATFIHSRRFLSYHGTRFKDMSMIFTDDDGVTIGAFPAALDPSDPSLVVSHPGITYGGILHAGRLVGDRMIHALKLLIEHYRVFGLRALNYKAVPYIYHQRPSDDDLYALFRYGARRFRCDLSSVIDLAARSPVSERRRRGFKKASAAGIEVQSNSKYFAPFWSVLEENLGRRHNAVPVHTYDEIMALHAKFPNSIIPVVALAGETIIAGVVLFVSRQVMHAQYIAAGEFGFKVNALDVVFEHCIDLARQQQKRYFDFGTSNESGGQVLNDGLYKFKTEFGGGGVAHEFYTLPLN